jgi:chemotaxis protein MotB
MRRARRNHDEHENHERWLVSYADFITLLFAFFVVMYAISQVNEGKYRVLSDSLLQAFKPDGSAGPNIIPPKNEPHSALPSGMVPRLPVNRAEEAKRRAREQRMRTIAQQVIEALAPLVQNGQVRVSESTRGMAVEINASMLFKSAQATLEPDSQRALIAVARVLAPGENPIEVEGHTDRDPISTPQFPSNWELSGARASSVVRLFVDHGVAPPRLVASGYADTRPVDSNETPEGRTRNRRVTVLIRPEASDEGAAVPIADSTAEPQSQPAAGMELPPPHTP